MCVQHGVDGNASSAPTNRSAASPVANEGVVERHSCIVPLKEVELGPELSIRVFATEDPTLKQTQTMTHKQPPSAATSGSASAAAGAASND